MTGRSPPDAAPTVASVLPGGEGFSPRRAGAIGLLVARLAGVPGRYRTVVLGQDNPALPGGFPGLDFRPVRTRLLPRLGARARYPGAVLAALRRLRPALIEVHNRPVIALRVAAALPRTPVVLVLHNDPQEMRRAHTAAERRVLLDRMAGIVAVSEWTRARLLDGVDAPRGSPGDGRGRAPVLVLPNCLDLASLPPFLPIGTRETLILYAGRTVVEKGADLFVRAAAAALPRLPGWRAVMVGARGHGPEGDALGYTPAGPTPAQAGVEVLGYRPNPEVLAWMGRAAIVVVPSRWEEPFGLVALEAMAMGAALICTRRGGLPEVAGEAAVYVDPADPDGIAAAIVALAQDAPRRERLAAAGRARAQGFDLGPAVAALEAFRQRVLEESRAGR